MSFWSKLFGSNRKQDSIWATEARILTPKANRREVGPADTKEEPGEEKSIERALAIIESKLRNRADPSLPVVSLALKPTALGKRIVWLYRTSYEGPKLDSAAAERLLRDELKPLGLRISPASYMGGGRGHEGEGSDTFTYIEASSAFAHFERDVDELDRTGYDGAAARAAELASQGKTDLLLAWLRLGKLDGFAAKALRTCASEGAAGTLIDMLNDPSSEVRHRAVNALGPLGGQRAAESLCLMLKNTSDYLEIGALAHAISRLRWAGAKSDLISAAQRVPNKPRLGVRAAVGMALVIACDAHEGFELLLEAVRQDGDIPEEFAGALNAKDDARAIPVMTELLARTVYGNNKSVAESFLSRQV